MLRGKKDYKRSFNSKFWCMLCSLFMKDILPAGKLFACLSLSKKIKLQKFMTKKLICVHLYSSPWTCNLMSGLDINVEMGFDLAELSSRLISSLQEVEAVLGWCVCVSRSCGLCVWQHSDILWGLSPSPCTGAEQCCCSRITQAAFGGYTESSVQEEDGKGISESHYLMCLISVLCPTTVLGSLGVEQTWNRE